MFGISGVELLLILVFAFIILGPDKLPEMAKTAGKAIARFRDAQKDMNEVLKENDLVDAKTGQAISNPVEMVERVAKVAADGKGEQMVRSMTNAATAAAASIIKPDNDDEPAGNDVSSDDVPADGVAPAVGVASSEDAAPVTKDESAPMSFAERKARYERERAAREAAAAKAASAEAQGDTESDASAETAESTEAREGTSDAAAPDEGGDA